MDSNILVNLAAEACDDKKAKDIHLIKINNVSSISDWILITEGLSEVQVKSIIKSVETKILNQAKLSPIRKEGIDQGKWALLDYGDVIVNVFLSETRKFYDLESFWGNGESKKYIGQI
tara:strand:- start:610 stop:963 length:354 start_codon:yes stop_codon:yes gene_type:complete